MKYLTEKLIKLLSNYPHSHLEKVEALLQLGKEVCAADYALFSSVKDYHYQINAKVEKKPLFDLFYTLDQTFCKDTIEFKSAQALDDVSESGLAKNYFHSKLNLNSFVSLPVIIQDNVIGTVSFYAEGTLVFDSERLNFLKMLCFHIQESYEFDEMNVKFEKYYSLLEKKNEDLTRFSYMVAHDLKAPLRAVNSLIDFMGDDLDEKKYDELPDHFTMIKGKTDHMHNLIRDILEYSKIGSEEIVSESISLKYFINDICFEVSMGGPNIEIYNRTEDYSVVNKKVFLYQAMSNIVNNAVKYSDKEKCVVEISSKDLGDLIEISIEDNGPGIAEKHREKIFEVFRKAHSRTDVESTGIGLSIVKRLVEKMGGEIYCTESESLGGSKFVFSLLKQVD